MRRLLAALLFALLLPASAGTLRVALQLEPPLLDPTVGAAAPISAIISAIGSARRTAGCAISVPICFNGLAKRSGTRFGAPAPAGASWLLMVDYTGMLMMSL